jgi:hypothetical protein
MAFYTRLEVSTALMSRIQLFGVVSFSSWGTDWWPVTLIRNVRDQKTRILDLYQQKFNSCTVLVHLTRLCLQQQVVPCDWNRHYDKTGNSQQNIYACVWCWIYFAQISRNMPEGLLIRTVSLWSRFEPGALTWEGVLCGFIVCHLLRWAW